MNALVDLRVASRGLARNKGFAAAAVFTLALGIAATTTIFSVVYGVLLRPLPYADSSRLVVIQGEKDFSTGPRIMNFSATEIETFTDSSTAFASLAASTTVALTLRSDAGVEPISGATVSATYFQTIATTALLGRTLGDESGPAVVISHRLWQRLFGGGEVLGRALTLSDRENVQHVYTVVGVMPLEFQQPRPRTDLWRPLAFARATGATNTLNPNAGGYEFIGRLKDGMTLEAARADVNRAMASAISPHLATSRVDMHALVTPLGEITAGTVRPALLMLFGAISLILLVACSNVANLILTRHASRSREVAVRMALGASRSRMLAHALVESAVIGVAGGLVGVGLAFGGVRLLLWLQPAQLPRLEAIAVDFPVLLFAAAVALAASLVAGLGPAIIATRADATLALRAGARATAGRATRRARSALVVVEIATSIVLLVGTALLSRSLAALIDADLGVNTENVMTAQLDLALGRSLTAARQIEIAEALRQRVAAIPSVRAVGFGTGVPPTGEYMRVSFVLSNAANASTSSHMVTSVPASPGYFEALRIPLIQGRLFTDADSADSSPAVIVNREAARRFFGNDDPIGRTLPIGKTSMNVVGVVENVKYTGIASPVEGVIYRPFGQSPFRLVIMVARTTGDPGLIAAELRQVIRTYDSDVNIVTIQPLTTWVWDAVAQPRVRVWLLGAIAGITLVLAMIGLYSVIAYATAQRTTEIGVRMAVGAQRSDVIRLVLWDGAVLAAAGAAVGITIAYFASAVLASLLFGVTATDATSFVAAAGVLVPVALLSSYVPARRAARLDPTVALRTE